MHVVVATPYIPWPLSEGGRVAQFETLVALKKHCTFTVIVRINNRQDEENVRIFSERCPHVTVRSVRRTAEPSDKLYNHWTRLLRKLVNFGRRCSKIVNPQIGLHAKAVFAPHYPFRNLDVEFIAAVEEELAKGCDLFQAEFAEMMTLGPTLKGRVPCIFIHHQLHFVYTERFLMEGRNYSVDAQYLGAKMACEEEAYLSQFDTVVVFSEVDRDKVSRICPKIDIAVSPFPSPEAICTGKYIFEQPTHEFVFIGSSNHGPNVDGLCWFLEEAWWMIRSKMPGAILNIVGVWTEATRSRLPKVEGVQFLGFVQDLPSCLKGRITIVPLWVGSGLRTKIMAAWSTYSPVVTTTIGVEGLPGESKVNCLIADSPVDFSDACLRLAGDPELLNRIAAGGGEIVRQQFSREAVCEQRLNVYNRTINRQRIRKGEHAASEVRDMRDGLETVEARGHERLTRHSKNGS